MIKRVALVIGLLIIVGLGIAVMVDRDPQGMLAGRIEARSAALAQFDGMPLTPEQKGAVYFAFGDFSALTSEALEVSASPWKLATALLALRHANGDLDGVTPEAVAAAFRSFGFVRPSRIANWPAGMPQPVSENPLGQTVDQARRLLPPIGLTIGNIA